ncbi:hypothetical protein CR51_19915 [Caballeronia megalochromosomata]|nr:hypothetical protein CR51_19915 [Caballeronia megalochromosomata]
MLLLHPNKSWLNDSPDITELQSMAKQTGASAKEQITPFFPTQAYLGYPKDYEKEPALKKRRREYADFSRKLRAILAPLLVNRYALHEDMLVLTSKGFSGQGVDVDCVAVTRFGVFVITHIPVAGIISSSQKANEMVVLSESGAAHTFPCPLWRAAPAVHFLSALLSDLQCPVQAIAIATHDACAIELGVPTAIFKLHELSQFLRQSYDRYSAVNWSFFDVNEINARLRKGCQSWDRAVEQAERDAHRS